MEHIQILPVFSIVFLEVPDLRLRPSGCGQVGRTLWPWCAACPRKLLGTGNRQVASMKTHDQNPQVLASTTSNNMYILASGFECVCLRIVNSNPNWLIFFRGGWNHRPVYYILQILVFLLVLWKGVDWPPYGCRLLGYACLGAKGTHQPPLDRFIIRGVALQPIHSCDDELLGPCVSTPQICCQNAASWNMGVVLDTILCTIKTRPHWQNYIAEMANTLAQRAQPTNIFEKKKAQKTLLEIGHCLFEVPFSENPIPLYFYEAPFCQGEQPACWKVHHHKFLHFVMKIVIWHSLKITQ